MTDLLDRRLLFVSGKGGVGKSTMAAALALLAAERGKKTLVCEVDAKGNLADFFETGPTGFEERQIHPGLWAMSMEPEASLRQYLQLQLRMSLLTRIGYLAKIFDFVATAAPGVREIVTVGKFCWEVKEDHYDIVIVDAPATGHIVGQLASPQAINELVRVGLVRQQTGWMLEMLGDPERTGLVIVTTPEEMPVTETISLSRDVTAQTNVQVAAILVNRVLPELFGRSEEVVFDRLLAAEQNDLVPSALDKALGGECRPLVDAAELAVTLRRTRAAHLQRLRAEIDKDVPLLYVPFLFTRSHGLRTTRMVAEALGQELGY